MNQDNLPDNHHRFDFVDIPILGSLHTMIPGPVDILMFLALVDNLASLALVGSWVTLFVVSVDS